MSLTSRLVSFLLIGQLFYMEVTSSVILVGRGNDYDLAADDVEDKGVNKTSGGTIRNGSERGIVDILENFRLWQLERRKEESTTKSAPTTEAKGLEALLPKIEIPKIDVNTLGHIVQGLSNAVMDIGKSFVGPPSTEQPEPVLDGNATNNASSTTPPNTFFCFLCNDEK